MILKINVNSFVKCDTNWYYILMYLFIHFKCMYLFKALFLLNKCEEMHLGIEEINGKIQI